MSLSLLAGLALVAVVAFAFRRAEPKRNGYLGMWTLAGGGNPAEAHIHWRNPDGSVEIFAVEYDARGWDQREELLVISEALHKVPVGASAPTAHNAAYEARQRFREANVGRVR